MPVEKFYSVDETCALLGGICRGKLWSLRMAGEIRFLRIDSRPVFPESFIVEYQQKLIEEAGGRAATATPSAFAAQDAGTSVAVN